MFIIIYIIGEYTWKVPEKLAMSGSPPIRTLHGAVSISDTEIFVFGGVHCYSPYKLLNDSWILDTSTFQWRSAMTIEPPKRSSFMGLRVCNGQQAPVDETDLVSLVLTSVCGDWSGIMQYPESWAPAPRSGHTCRFHNGSVILFGGSGGFGFARRYLNDIHVFNAEEKTWKEIACLGNPPAVRCGHGAVIDKAKMYVFGGWNHETQFNDLFVLDLVTNDWTDLDLSYSVPRWNLSLIHVPALPNAKIFLFGGSVLDQGRGMGTADNRLAVLDLGSMCWEDPVLETCPPIPSCRENGALVHDSKTNRIILFGGWSNKWFADIWTIDVSAITGPPYALSSVVPSLGPISGSTRITLHGEGFDDFPCVVKFSLKTNPNENICVAGKVLSPTQIECLTPPSNAMCGPVSISVQLGTRDFTNTSVGFSYFLDSAGSHSLCYGPGILLNQASGETLFWVQARNGLGQDRLSGGDLVELSFQTNPTLTVLFQVEDLNNGKYLCKYPIPLCDNGTVSVKISGQEIRGSPFPVSFVASPNPLTNTLAGPLVGSHIVKSLKLIDEVCKSAIPFDQISLNDDNVENLISVLAGIKKFQSALPLVALKRDEVFAILSTLGGNEKTLKQARKLSETIEQTTVMMTNKMIQIKPLLDIQAAKYRQAISFFETIRLPQFREKKLASTCLFYLHVTGSRKSLEQISEIFFLFEELQKTFSHYEFVATNFEYLHLLDPSSGMLTLIEEEMTVARNVWELIAERETTTTSFMLTPLDHCLPDQIEETMKTFQKRMKELKIGRKTDVFLVETNEWHKRWLVFAPLLAELKDPSMRDRHWSVIATILSLAVPLSSSALVSVLFPLWKFADQVAELTDQAKQEGKMEKFLTKLNQTWSVTKFITSNILSVEDENFEMLEDHQVQVQNMFASRFLATFESEVVCWQKCLGDMAEVVALLSEVQRTWTFLRNLFVLSEEVKKELPSDTERFAKIDTDVLAIVALGKEISIISTFCSLEGMIPRLEQCLYSLNLCEKSLNEFMDGKRRAFPRFYFVSTVDLLDILSNGNSPAKVMVHLSKVFQAVQTYRLVADVGRPLAVGMESCVGTEYVPFPIPLLLEGKVEIYMQSCIGAFQNALKFYANKSLQDCVHVGDSGRGQWIKDSVVGQCVLLTSLIMWVRSVEDSFASLRSGNKSALIDAKSRSANLLLDLIKLTQTSLDKPTRQKLMCMITLDAHNRDVQESLITENVTSVDAFQWQAQLKGYALDGLATLRIADAAFDYGYEYLGNGSRLVVTPLTDRIYVTCTQALHLHMGCAPAGPAGTGKTESTKDLSNALGKPCYVFNASPEMDYKSMGNIFKGLAASGSYGCFDEFNRLIPEVLSVCTVQFKAVCDAIRGHLPTFNLQGDEISLDSTCGVFITMNPGYLGRSNLPEGLKALFRPVTVMVADYNLIISNCLMSEGFINSDQLAKKFSTLYALCGDLLSKSKQYDWGMRAIKSVLVVAGGFKRADPGLSEEAVLMRALRDTNIAKIDGDDLKIFMGLLSDLFPGVVVPRSRDLRFEQILKDAIAEFGYTNDSEGYLMLKITQLVELMEIRHCIFMMGPPGSFKSAVWRILAKAKEKNGEKVTWIDLNPKSISTQELYGYVNMSTREWKDGILSKTMRALSQASSDGLPKWIILDGDLDANWIESMNSVMDDNKLLTLPSNERIPLRNQMRMIFEIRDLNFATPATVTRAGVVNMTDVAGIQWKCYYQSWIDRQTVLLEETRFSIAKLFEKYLPETLMFVRKQCKVQVPIVDISTVQSLCMLLEGMLNVSMSKELVELVFVFATIWAAGGALCEIDGIDYRKLFSSWWKNDMARTVKFPSKGSVFDYCVNFGSSKLEEWTASPVDYSSEIPMSLVTIPTCETVSNAFLIETLLAVHHPVMLTGLSGSGKTQQSLGILASLSKSVFCTYSINMNYYTDSSSLQTMLEIPLEKKAGKLFAPPGKLHLIYFIDDLNMPALDPYNTQSAISLLRQCQDYRHWYDRQKITLKDIGNTQLLCALNPAAGSFTIDQRLQRHFWTCSVALPDQAALSTIYGTFLKGHFDRLGFKPPVLESISTVLKAGLQLHQNVCKTFRKTATNFHYEFNLRHLSNIFSGLLQVSPNEVFDAEKCTLLWIHESERVYGDRLVHVNDLKKYKSLVGDISKKIFKTNLTKYFQEKNPEPIIFAPFAKGFEEPCYDRIVSIERLTELVAQGLAEYNDSNPAMDLVLFEDAVKHVAKLARILTNGHALLVGVGGSGRQSLTRLASFIIRAQTMGIVISSTYSLTDLKNDLQSMYNKAGIKDEKIVFLFTDGQITNEKFLVYINDLLASGDIADLYTVEEKDAIRNTVRSACKGEGILDTPENLWQFFINRVKKNLHMAICFSPVGDAMRNRARKFPALINCSVIDWFQPWPKEALRSVATKFLGPIELLGGPDDVLRKSITEFIPFSFECVSKQAELFMTNERRFAYTTPKSFLEQLKLYTHLLNQKLTQIESKRDTLTNGLAKLRSTESQVTELEIALKEKAVIVELKAREADEFATRVGIEKGIVNIEVEKAAVEKEICQEIAVRVSAQAMGCEEDLAKAIPLVLKAEAALDVLNKKDFQELKSFAKPPPGVDKVLETCIYLLAGIDTSIEVDKRGKVRDASWKASQKIMSNPDRFLENLKSYKPLIDEGKIPKANIEMARPLTLESDFTVESMTKKSKAAAGLCEWVINIIMYYEVVESVEPKKKALREATETLRAANEKLAAVDALVAELQTRLAKLISDFDGAIAEKAQVLAESEKCRNKLDLAQRLIGALGANGSIWEASIASLSTELELLPGNTVLAASFVSYLGVFSGHYREVCLKEFSHFLATRGVAISHPFEPLKVLATEAELAQWQTEGLPSDRVSCENGAILMNSQRWCLLLDPQGQGIVWLKSRFGDLVLTRMGGPMNVVEQAIEAGKTVLIENMGEGVDAVLAPVIGRNTIRRGRSRFVKLGDKEVSYNDKFKLLLHSQLSNPHYPPEIQAECTVINFTVTERGLEEQLLFQVVKLERSDLANQKSELINAQNQFKVKLAELEELLLEKLANATGDILEDTQLVTSLEEAKQTSDEVKQKVIIAKETEARINATSEIYRPCATRGALLFFFLQDLQKMHSFYKYSLDSFLQVIVRAITSLSVRNVQGSIKSGGSKPPLEETDDGNSSGDLSLRDLHLRVELLMKTISSQSFAFVSRGLLDCHKLTAATMLCFRILTHAGAIAHSELQTLITGLPNVGVVPDCLKLWISDSVWSQLRNLQASIPTVFKTLCANMESESLSWKRWVGEERLESADLPRSMRELSPFHKLMLIRVLRPDRISNALAQFVSTKLGPEYIEKTSFDMEKVYAESSNSAPIFFVLFPGVDPTPVVESMARKLGSTLVNISMGQGQEELALSALAHAASTGGWVMLQNIHLMQSWLKSLERTLDSLTATAHENFRCILSSEPPPQALMEIVPESILQKSVKVADEAPEDIKSNLRRSWTKFSQASIDLSSKPRDFKACLFGLCFFHSLVIGRKRFGSQGWSRVYPFNDGDLTICAAVLHNYLERNSTIPWPDIRYIFGDIMYGGHVTDQWDRRINNTYLETLIISGLLTNMPLAPGFKSPDAAKMDFNTYLKFIEERLPGETPQMFGLHPNAETGFLTTQAHTIFGTIQSIAGQRQESSSSYTVIQDLISGYLASLPKGFDMITIRNRIQEWNPYIIVALQESERMNTLLHEIRRSLVELEMGLSGALNISDQMEELMKALAVNKVPSSWEKLAYYSLKSLSEWLIDLSARVAQLVEWTTLLEAPKSVWISGLFNPMSYLTAVTQVTARKFDLPLDCMTNRCVITNIREPKIELTPTTPPPANGVYIHGMFMEGASWEDGKGEEEGYITDSKLKVLHPPMPVMNVYAVDAKEMDWDNMYRCPVYITSQRGPTYLFTANIRMEPDDNQNRWILAGAALLLTDD